MPSKNLTHSKQKKPTNAMADTSTPQGEIPEETLSQAIDLWLSANPGYACCGKQDRSDLELLRAGEHLYDYQILPIARALHAKDRETAELRVRIGELEAALQVCADTSYCQPIEQFHQQVARAALAQRTLQPETKS
jgi:hypothetical protein